VIVVKVELWPFGNEDHKRSIAESRIWNTLLRDPDGKYLYGYDIDTDGVKERDQREVMHRRDDGIWELIRVVLNDRENRGKGRDV
jgi:hypothetical protein